jgi:nucleotide-binding universal stress UspA family protein
LIIIDASISFQKRFEGVPSVFLEQLLKKTECPVFVAPESFDGCEEIIFAYDGSKSAMFAIRQFASMFPGLRNVKLTVLEVADENDQLFTEQDRLAQWLKNYFSNIDYKLLYGRPKDELFGYLLEKEKIIVVMGAFGRTMLSSFISKSNAELILKAVNLPVFISHT